jgi:hypothetical protein
MQNEPEYLSQEEFFSTFDLGLTSALFCLEHELYAVDKDNSPSKAQFIFRRDKTIERDIEAYWNTQLKLNARSYFDAIRCVKNRLYSS